MRHLFGLFRNLVRLFFAGPQLLSNAITATFTVLGFSIFTGHPVITLHSVGRIVDAAISLVGYLVVANIVHHHLNKVLERIIREINASRGEARQTAMLLRELISGAAEAAANRQLSKNVDGDNTP